ncbi:hypothetical protein SASPL_117683 [Salvia splendens]|uniref:STAS domain-containing protein n=1 Tax=Salvia splendens TaxID=180675 RepID=A0A8X8XYC9_SALSN|nr:hypothetical protein SASPL_117683 [Salvia splendens]
MGADEEYPRCVNFGPARSFGIMLKSKMKETFFPDDPFFEFKREKSVGRGALKALQYFIPILEWLPNYSFDLFKYDLLAGITIASLAIPQGISYANLAQIPPIIGLYSSFVPPLLYAVFGSSKHLAVGTVAACSLLISETIEKKAAPSTDLYARYTGGFSVAFDNHGIHGRNSSAYNISADEGIAWLKAFHHAHRRSPFELEMYTHCSNYVFAPLKAGIITGVIALTEGIAIGRSFALSTNEQIDGNKEMIAYGVMNIVGSMTSCYLTTGPFSKTAVNFNSGCKTPMANVVQSVCMLMVLLFLAPLFSYTPHVALSAIIISAMLGLIKYKKAYHLFHTDKFDFVICMSAFFGVSFISMDMGLILSVGLALVRAMLYVARPATCKLGNIPNSNLYRDVEQYPGTIGHSGTLILQLGSPIYFANANYIKERILRWVRDENESSSTTQDIEYVLLDLGGVTAIDHTGVEAVLEVRKTLGSKGIKIMLVNPRIDVMDKLILMGTVDKIGREAVYLSTEDALNACKFTQSQTHDLMDVAL